MHLKIVWGFNMDKHEILLQFFEFKHLPPHLQKVSEQFYIIAYDLVALIPENSELTMALRKLLEAKDCAVRAKIMSITGQGV